MKKLTLILPLIFCVLISCQDKTAEIELKKIVAQQSTEELNKSIVNKWLNEVNKDNYENLFGELWAENSKQYFNSNKTPVEYKEFKDMVYQLYKEYPIIIHDVQEIIAKEDKVIVRFSANVLHDTSMFGVPATDKEIVWNAIAIFQLSEGKIQNRWEVTDELGKYKQLGMELQIVKDAD